MSSAPLSAASAARARNRQAGRGGQPVPSSTSRSRDAASALSDRRRRRRGEDDGISSTTRISSSSGERSASSAVRSDGDARGGGNPFAFTPVPQQQRASSQRRAEQHENLVRGVLHKRRDHLTYGSSAWRPRLFVLDKPNKTLTYYLLSSSRRQEAGRIPTTPIPVRGNADSPNDSPSVGMQTPARTFSTPATSDPHPLDATIDALSLDVNPRGVISLRNCVVRAIDDASVEATMRTPGRPRNREGGNEGRLFGMVLSPKRQRRQGGSASAAIASEIKNDIYLATSTENDRNQWLPHLAMACGMATSPVPGGLRSASAPPPSVGRRREIAEAREEQAIGGVAIEAGDGHGGGSGASGEVKGSVSTDTTSLAQTPESQRNRPSSSAVATPVTVSTPLRSAARRIFSTPSAAASESEAGSSTMSRASVTSRLGTSAIGGMKAVKNKHFLVSKLSVSPLLEAAAIMLAPPILVRFVRLVAPLSPFSGALPQLLLFLLLIRWSIRQIVLSLYLGRPLANRGALHGPVTCRIAIDLRGVLRFIGNKREERTPLLQGTDNSSSLSHVSVTHIVARAVAIALSEVAPELNCRYRSLFLLGLEGWYQNQGGCNVSVVSTSSQRVSTIKKTEDCTVQEIADQVWNSQREETERAAAETQRLDLEPPGDILSSISSWAKAFLFDLISAKDEEACSSSCCIIYTSPDSENNEVDIDVAPRPIVGAAPIVVVVGGVRVVDRDPRNASFRQSRRPMLSVSITIDCPMSSIATCRKFAEKVQTLVQFPEMCE